MNPLQEYPLEKIVEDAKRRPNGKVLGQFQCLAGHMVLFQDYKGYGIMVVEKDRFHIVSTDYPTGILDAGQIFGDYVIALLEDQRRENPVTVSPENACQNCGENQMDKLVWVEADVVECQQCGDQRTFAPTAGRAGWMNWPGGDRQTLE